MEMQVLHLFLVMSCFHLKCSEHKTQKIFQTYKCELVSLCAGSYLFVLVSPRNSETVAS